MTPPAPASRLPTVRALLLWLVLACLLPGVLGAGAMFAYQYRQSREQLERTTILTARALMQAVDHHLLKVQAVAQTLSTSDALAAGDLRRFHAEAREAMKQVGLATNVVLRDEAGRQLLNTVIDWGRPLPAPPAPEQVQPVFEGGKPVISDIFMGPVLKRPILSVDVPVYQGGSVRYALGVGILPSQIDAILSQQQLPADWVTGVLDRRGVLAARTRAPAAWVGRLAAPSLLAQVNSRPEGTGPATTSEGLEVVAFYSRSPLTGWTVAIGIPRQVVDAVFVRTSSLAAAGVALLFGISTLVAWRIGGRIAQSFQGLSAEAADIGEGRAVMLPTLRVQEAAEVGRRLQASADLLAQRTATLRESEARFKALADNIGQLAWVSGPDGRMRWYNRRWYDYTGAASGQDWQEFHHPDHARRVRDGLERSLRAAQPWEDTFPLRGRDGEYRWFLSSAFALRDPASGEVSAWFGTHTDVTAQLQAQQALVEADQRKDEFIAILAHELRNPLAPVRTAVEILRRGGDEDAGRRRAREVIERQVAHMARLIDDLLDVSRIARGKLALVRERCDLAAIARQTAEDYRPSLEAAGLALAVRTTGPLWVDGDPVRLAQMVGNLLNNAERFTDPGGRVEVWAQGEGEGEGGGAGLARVRVVDTGIGIPAQLLPRLFDPFSQADQDLARTKGGLGLGLALTRGLAELHGGQVAARSEGPGKGAEFVLELPLAAPREALPEPADPPAAAAPAPSGRRVLVIEDNVDAAQTLGELLSLDGHEVRLAFDGESGVRAAREFAPEVVVSDIGLPGTLDGYAVARALRAEPALAGLRLVALSGYADEPSRRRSREAGFDAHLAKPADLGALEEAMAGAQPIR